MEVSWNFPNFGLIKWFLIKKSVSGISGSFGMDGIVGIYEAFII